VIPTLSVVKFICERLKEDLCPFKWLFHRVLRFECLLAYLLLRLGKLIHQELTMQERKQTNPSSPSLQDAALLVQKLREQGANAVLKVEHFSRIKSLKSCQTRLPRTRLN
jgi:hypothetical protein